MLRKIKQLKDMMLNVGYITPFTFDSDYSNSGVPFGLSFGSAITKRLIVGAELGLSNLTTKEYYVDKTYGYDTNMVVVVTADSYSYNRSTLAIYFMGNAQYHWLVKEKTSMYSGLSVGSIFGSVSTNFSDNGNHKTPDYSISGVAYQITALGIRSYFNKHIGVHLELGYGNRGIVGGGLDVKF
jgi:hypothetical protein